MLIPLMMLLSAASHHSPLMDRCMAHGEAAQGVTPAMFDCAHAEYLRRDAALNGSYRAAMARIPAARRPALVAAERAWIHQRDRACDPMMAPENGSIGPLDREMCLIDRTAAQTIALNRWR